MAKGNDGLWASFLPASRGKTPQDLEILDFLRMKKKIYLVRCEGNAKYVDNV